ncbi:hypothetical protein MA04_02027 [Alcanivorax balearicus MACL04]|uniref:DUF58 domain-containing protein n=1 Tax=Alloalcanivorax balearicus MACL04 TaxID=1177182 RepID=A0ABT2QYY9_9GAMM|nr:DUF58 domain-containing protein [Alloalcanivorax balearicus]MCU5782727.1 hypothetical protein [Alloalcanivorax balearicus MACL04]
MVKRAWQNWLARRLPRDHQVQLNQRRIFILPSGYGVLYLVVALLLFLGGVNYENNLILALCFLMVSLFVMGILHTFRNLSGLTLRAGAARNGFVGGHGGLAVVLVSQGQPHRSVWLSWPGQDAQEVSLETGEEKAVWLNLALPRRGPVRPHRLRVESRYPLGLLRAWSLVALEHHCLAWPRPREDAPSPWDGSGGSGGTGRHGSEAFQGLRAYVLGDSLRQVDWKGYARGRGMNTKLFDAEEGERLWLGYDRLEGLPEEQRLALLCHWVLLLSEAGQPFGLRLPAMELAPGSGDEHRLRALDLLALHGNEGGQR